MDEHGRRKRQLHGTHPNQPDEVLPRPELLFVNRLFVTLASVAMALQGADRAWTQTASRDAGYLYLSPVPEAPYVSPQTRYVLVRFKSVLPADVTNLLTGFIS